MTNTFLNADQVLERWDMNKPCSRRILLRWAREKRFKSFKRGRERLFPIKGIEAYELKMGLK